MILRLIINIELNNNYNKIKKLLVSVQVNKYYKVPKINL